MIEVTFTTAGRISLGPKVTFCIVWVSTLIAEGCWNCVAYVFVKTCVTLIENIGSIERAEGRKVGFSDTGTFDGWIVGSRDGCTLAGTGRGSVYGGDKVIDLLETAPVALHFDAKQVA